MMEKNPSVTHKEIGREIEKSQPAVGARIIKLERKHLITRQVGLNVKEVDIKVAMVFISTKAVEEIARKIKDFSFINLAFKISGEYNILCYIAASDLQTIEKIVDLYFRRDPNVLKTKITVIIESIHDFVIPIDFQIDNLSENEPIMEI